MSAEEKVGSYRKLRLPDTRRITIDMLEATSRKHWMSGLIEVDVTRAREALARRSCDERPPSLTTWVVKCISQGAVEHPEVHGARRGRDLVIFDDVDISVVIESERHGKKVPRPYVIRKTNSKSLEEISGEIEAFRSQHTDDLVLGNRRGAASAGGFILHLPAFLRRWLWRRLARRPFLVKRMAGTVVVTSLGMFGSASGWAMPVGTLPLSIAVGSITRKPGVVDDRIEVREFLNLTVMFDHEVVDGAPAARFISRLAELMEGAYGLEEGGDAS